MPDESAAQQTQSSRLGTAERAGLIAAAASVGPSFQRGLLPRNTMQQAGLTGAMGALNYGLTTTIEAMIESIAFRVAGSDNDEGSGRLGVMLIGNLAAVGAGLAAQRLLAQRPRESLLRAGARSLAWRVTAGATAGSITVAVDSAAIRVRPNSRTAGVPATLVAGALIGGGLFWQDRRRLVAQGVESDALGQPVDQTVSRAVLESAGVGLGITTLLYAGAKVESLAAAGIGQVVGYAVPYLAPVGKSVGHMVTLAAMGYGGLQALNRVDRLTEKAGVSVVQ